MIEWWHVILGFSAVMFIGFCILRNRPVKTDADIEIEEAQKRAADMVSEFVDNDLKHRVVMAKDANKETELEKQTRLQQW